MRLRRTHAKHHIPDTSLLDVSPNCLPVAVTTPVSLNACDNLLLLLSLGSSTRRREITSAAVREGGNRRVWTQFEFDKRTEAREKDKTAHVNPRGFLSTLSYGRHR